MNGEFDWLKQEFKKHGGVFENIGLGYKDDRGYYCKSLKPDEDVTIYCPDDLLINIEDVAVCDGGLYLDNSDQYGESAEFLNRYLVFHFSRDMLDDILRLKNNVESLSETDRALLAKLNLPEGHGSYSDELSFIKKRIEHSHCIESKDSGNRLIMPFLSFLNHDKTGVPFKKGNENYGSGFCFTGRFDGEAFALYNHSDPLAVFMSYGFVADTRFVYSLPMAMQVSKHLSLRIERNIASASIDNNGNRWPTLRKEGSSLTVSWVPLYCEEKTVYPAIIMMNIAKHLGVSGEQLLYMLVRQNLSVLVPAAFQLSDSGNAYCRLVSECARKQLELIAQPLTP